MSRAASSSSGHQSVDAYGPDSRPYCRHDRRCARRGGDERSLVPRTPAQRYAAHPPPAQPAVGSSGGLGGFPAWRCFVLEYSGRRGAHHGSPQGTSWAAVVLGCDYEPYGSSWGRPLAREPHPLECPLVQSKRPTRRLAIGSEGRRRAPVDGEVWKDGRRGPALLDRGRRSHAAIVDP